jgi:superfamily I DNA/RNA helicase
MIMITLPLKEPLQKPPRGIGDKVIRKIQDVSYGLNKSYKEAAAHLVMKGSLPPNARASLRNLLIFLKSLKNNRTDIAIQRILDVMGYYEYLKTHSKDYPKSEESIEQLLKLAEGKTNLVDFLESFSLDPDQEVGSDEADNDRIKLSTIHSAKGLEYQVIFLCGMEEGSLPHFHAVAKNNPHGEEIKEERRIAYVGMTRSTDYLCITYVKSRNMLPRNYSRFLCEINQNLFHHI